MVKNGQEKKEENGKLMDSTELWSEISQPLCCWNWLKNGFRGQEGDRCRDCCKDVRG